MLKKFFKKNNFILKGFFAAFFLILQNFSLHAQDREITVDPTIKVDSLSELTSQLEAQKKASQPFDEKDIKIDPESLGLDMDEKKNNEEEVVAQDKTKEQKQEIEQPKEEESSTPSILSKIQGFINRDFDQEKIPEKNQEGKNPTSNSDIKKSTKNYLNSKGKMDLKTRIELEKSKAKTVKQKKEKEKKLERLNKLRQEYLIRLNYFRQENQASVDNKIIIPQEKLLNWSDRFASNENPAPPIVNRFRGNDNQHIPIILDQRERYDILFSTITSGNVAAFNEAYQDILDPDAFNVKGDTILTQATLLQKYPIMLAILKNGADPDLANDLGHTPLDIAIELLDLKAVQILVEMGADINSSDDYGRTYLMHAVRVGYFPIVDFLVSKGVNINDSDSDGHTALSIAYRHKKEIIAKYLLKHGAKTWIDKPYNPDKQRLIKDLENRWKKPKFNSN